MNMEGHAFNIIQISDMHLFADPEKELLGVKTQKSFEAVVEFLKKEEKNIDLLLLSGDLSQDGSSAAYVRLANILKMFHVPIYYLPGNHDNVKVMSHIYPRDNISNHTHVLLKSWQLILLNSQKIGSVEGYLDQSQLDYMQECLQTYPEHWAIIFFHHQPMPVHCGWLDKLGITNAHEFWKMVKLYSKIHSIIFGHIHQAVEKEINGIKCYSAPSTCIQFKRDQNDFGLENLNPGYRWITLHEDGRLETGVKRIAHYVGTFDADAKGY